MRRRRRRRREEEEEERRDGEGRRDTSPSLEARPRAARKAQMDALVKPRQTYSSALHQELGLRMLVDEAAQARPADEDGLGVRLDLGWRRPVVEHQRQEAVQEQVLGRRPLHAELLARLPQGRLASDVGEAGLLTWWALWHPRRAVRKMSTCSMPLTCVSRACWTQETPQSGSLYSCSSRTTSKSCEDTI
ncbi:unnamed protein product [Prorocentrum cordatum]|uniref:Uncharacterized protein n=1 Tax=Prorocentrum cordatum TaxID=2364126 RepID=A0ABN9RAE8_9DINO|nr:unnamed protein product [Polarella glacialis]